MPDAESRWLRSDSCDFMRIKYMIIADGHGSSMEYKYQGPSLRSIYKPTVYTCTMLLFSFMMELVDVRTSTMKAFCFGLNKS